MTLSSIRTTDIPFFEVKIVTASHIFAVSRAELHYTKSRLFQNGVRKWLLLLLISDYFVSSLFPNFRFTTLFLFSFPVTHSSPLLFFHPPGFCDCFQTHVSFYFSILLCLSSYCTCNPLRASVSLFLCILLCSLSSIPSFFLTSLCFSLVSSDIVFQLHLFLVSTCSCFFSGSSSFSSVYLNHFAAIAFRISDQILLLEKLLKAL